MKDWHVGLIVVVVIAAVVALFAFQPGTWNVMGRADISDVMSLWSYEFGDAEGGCLNISGEWHEDDDWWGCEDANFPDNTHCLTEIARIIEDMCEGMHAEWTYNRDNAYCRYE